MDLIKHSFVPKLKKHLKFLQERSLKTTWTGILSKFWISLSANVKEASRAVNYFKMTSNFELTIRLTDNFTLANAQEYFEKLGLKIIDEDLTQIIFK